MALGTITQLVDDSKGLNLPTVAGAIKFTLSTIVGDGAYATGGTSLSAAQLGLPTTLVYAVVVGLAGSAANNGAIQASFNNSTKKLQCWASTGTSPVGLVEVAATTNLSGVTITVMAYGF